MANFYTDNQDIKFHLSHPLMEEIAKLKERNFADKDKYDYAPFDFKDAIDSYEKVLEIVGEISGETIAPNAEMTDEQGNIVKDNKVIYAQGIIENLDALKKANLMGYTLPRKYGGLNLPTTTYAMAGEIMSRADAGFVNIFGLQDCGETINEFASQETKDRLLPLFVKGKTGAMALTEPDAGSDLQAVQLKATYDQKNECWRLNGVKRFITNGNGDILLVLARSEENTTDARGLSMFVVEKTETVLIRRLEHKLGINGSPTCEMIFNDTPSELIGERKLGLIKYVMSLMNAARLDVGAQSLGISEAAYREALQYASEREQFGKKIIKFPAVYEMLANMKAKIDAIRSLLYETARFTDIYKIYTCIQKEKKLEPEERKILKYNQKLIDIYTPLLKGIASEYANSITYDAIQIHGGTGYMKDFPAERLYRDARITSIYEGTTQLQVIAAVRGVYNGSFLKKIEEYKLIHINKELEYLKNILISMTKEYSDTIEKVSQTKIEEYLSFHARRLVEMTGNIIMGYLLLFDANRDNKYERSAQVFINKTKSENLEKADYINSFEINNLNSFKI
jgi:alkylation response protein AidB-like acyl-CoA dehydrogenase